jgi:hypothetical protein
MEREGRTENAEFRVSSAAVLLVTLDARHDRFEDHLVDPPSHRERLVPPIVQMHRPNVPHLALDILPPPRSPLLLDVLFSKRIRQAIVDATRDAVGEAVREDLERLDAVGDEGPPDFVVETRSPVDGTLGGRRVGGHRVKHLAEVGRVAVEVHHGAVERLVGLVCERVERELRGEKRRRGGRGRTVAVPLCHPLRLAEYPQIPPRQDRVEVDPDSAESVENEDPNEIAVNPSLLVRHLEQLVVFHRRRQCEDSLVDGSDREAVAVELEEGLKDGEVGEGRGRRSVGPKDDGRGGAVLCGEDGVEKCDLSGAEGQEVAAPVGVENRCFGEDHVGSWSSRKGGGEIVAVATEGHAHPGMDVDVSGSGGKGGVVRGGGDPGGVEASRGEGSDRKDRLLDPASGKELNLDVDLVGAKEDQSLRGAQPPSSASGASWTRKREAENVRRAPPPLVDTPAFSSSTTVPLSVVSVALTAGTCRPHPSRAIRQSDFCDAAMPWLTVGLAVALLASCGVVRTKTTRSRESERGRGRREEGRGSHALLAAIKLSKQKQEREELCATT